MPDTHTHCTHDGFHSGEARYRRATAQLRYVVVCDACLAEISEVGVTDYRPEFRESATPRG